MNLLDVILPELVLIAVACGLFLLGTSTRVAARRAAAWIALAGVVVVVLLQGQIVGQDAVIPARGGGDSVEVGPFGSRMLTWPNCVIHMFGKMCGWPWIFRPAGPMAVSASGFLRHSSLKAGWVTISTVSGRYCGPPIAWP